jgi:predicted enzyme related to lactoylglutathione lyase
VPIDVLFAGIAVSDLEDARPWYDLLLGRPADIIVDDDEVMWRIAGGAWIYLVRDPERAGRALVTLAVPDLESAMAEIRRRGLGHAPIEAIEGAGSKASVLDPQGNQVTFIEELGSQD